MISLLSACATTTSSSTKNFHKPAKVSSQGFTWPVDGKVICYYGENKDTVSNSGIDIYGNDKNCVIVSAKHGSVTFARQLKGYGNTVIVEHTNGITSVYSNLASIMVKEGSVLTRNQPIGKIDKDSNFLHLEIRKDGKPQDPLKYLP